jgi:hypothetical protein
VDFAIFSQNKLDFSFFFAVKGFQLFSLLKKSTPVLISCVLTFLSVSQRDDWSDAGLVAKFKTMNPVAWYPNFRLSPYLIT